jgi:glycosyltransferase involved in cell wall biosynthesis
MADSITHSSHSSAMPQAGSRGGILLFGMYDLARLDRAPEVRIARMTEALSRQTHTERICGGRWGRTRAWVGWLARRGPVRVSAVYVESSTASAMPTDLLFLALMRLLRRPVGVYFRDAYQLYRNLYPRRRRRQILSDWLWRLTTPILARIASHRFVPSQGLAGALRLRRAVVLGPGADPGLPDLGAGKAPLVAYVGNTAWADGFDLLLDAMAIVHDRCPEARLRVVGPGLPEERQAALPPYVEFSRSGRDGLSEKLADARVCVIPRPRTVYSDLAVPIKLWDYLSLGKPVVATAATETERILAESGAGIAVPDTPIGLAEGLLGPLTDPRLAGRLAASARAFASSPRQTWDARAGTILRSLGVAPESPQPDETAKSLAATRSSRL